MLRDLRGGAPIPLCQREGVHSTLAAVIGVLLVTPYSVKSQAPHAGRLDGGSPSMRTPVRAFK